MADENHNKEASAEIIRELLQGAIPINPVPTKHEFITREELTSVINHIESKIENAALRQKQWVLSGVLAIVVAFGGGYVSLVSKLDRLNESLPALVEKVDERTPWMQRQERRDSMQDQALQDVNPKYKPLPYLEPPQ